MTDDTGEPTGQEKPDPVKPEIDLPDDYEDEAVFLEDMRTDFAEDLQVDKNNRDAELEDLKFLVGDQWDDTVRSRREAARKPVMTINRLIAFVAQLVGQRRLNETTIKVHPDNGGTTAIARIREGLMRSVQKVCRADLAYDVSLFHAAACGIGNFQVELDWSNDDVWAQDINIKMIPDPHAVVWDRMLIEPTGRDAGHCFVIDNLKRTTFKKRWAWAQPGDMTVDSTLIGDLRTNGWMTADDVRVVTYWRMRTRKRTIALTNDGATLDITDELDPEHPEFDEEQAAQLLANIAQRKDGTPVMREVNKKYAQAYICSGLDILEGPYNLDIPRVPVFRVPAWEVVIAGVKHRWGLVRFLKDPQRMHNFWRSAIAEKLMQTPRGVWLAPDTAVAGREKDFRNSHMTDDPLLVWNAESGQKPERLPPAQLEEALLGQAEITTQDMKDVSNIHEANLGMPSNEVSGAAIIARQRVSDTGTIIYHDNLAMAIEQCGQVCNELVPAVYDTPRMIKVLGADGKQDLVLINMEGDPRSVDITTGKYLVTVATGPAYATKRMEAAESMMNLANAMPQIMGVAADLIVEAQDWPKADEIARRLRAAMPPGILSPDDMSPEQQAQAAAGAQKQAQAEKLALGQAVAAYMKTQSETAMNNARARNFEVQADSIPARMNTEAMSAASQAAERELSGHLEAIRTADGK